MHRLEHVRVLARELGKRPRGLPVEGGFSSACSAVFATARSVP
jgi:hypothetical protein